MADFSVSLHEDDSFNLDHDNRKYLSKNIDASRVSENISYEGNISLREFYEQTFQKAYEEYIYKKRHIQRRPKDVEGWPEKYYDFVAQKQAEGEAAAEKAKREGTHQKETKTNYTKIAKQIIIQVGNVDDFDGLTPEEQQELRAKMRDVLKEYMDTFQAENPNLRIVNAVIHMDEMSLSPHLHLTYVPVVEQSRGQSVANSLRGALHAMGFKDDKETPADRRFEHCQMKWQTKERERVIEIAGRHGLDVGYNKGNKSRGQTIDEYRAAKQAEREATREQLQIDAQNEALDRREAQVAEQEEHLDHRETVVQKKEERIDARVAEVNTYLQHHKAQVDEANQALDEREAAIEEREQILQAEAEASVRKIETAVSEAIASVKPAPGKRMEDYASSKMKKGHRLVPDKDLETYIDRSWYRPEHIKKTMQNVVDKFNELPFVQAARETIFRLEQQVLQLKRTIQSLKQKNKEQQVLLDKAKELKIDTFGKSMYDRLVDEVAKDREKVSEMYDHDSDILGR